LAEDEAPFDADDDANAADEDDAPLA